MWRLRVRPSQPASGGLGRHCPAQLHGSVRQRTGGADERGGKPAESRAFRLSAAPVRFQKAVSRSKENAAVERREARRSALWAGSSLPQKGRVRSQDGPTGRRSGPRLSALRYPLFEVAKGSKPTIWNGSPPGCAARQHSRTDEKMHGGEKSDNHSKFELMNSLPSRPARRRASTPCFAA